MAFQTYRLAVKGFLIGQEMVNIFHYAKPDGDPDDVPQELAEAWITSNLPRYLDCLPAGYQASTVTARVVGSTTQYETNVTAGGSRIGVFSAPQLAPTITWTTRFATRSARGRTYLPGLVGSDVDQGILVVNLLNAMALFADAQLVDLVGPSATFVFSVHSTLYGTTRDVVSYRVNSVVRTQRRRELGVGA